MLYSGLANCCNSPKQLHVLSFGSEAGVWCGKRCDPVHSPFSQLVWIGPYLHAFPTARYLQPDEPSALSRLFTFARRSEARVDTGIHQLAQLLCWSPALCFTWAVRLSLGIVLMCQVTMLQNYWALGFCNSSGL